MIDREIVRMRAAPPAPIPENAQAAAEIAAKLDEIVVRSRRPSLVRRGIRRVGRRLTRWVDNLVPPAPPRDDTEPPEIRFPFF